MQLLMRCSCCSKQVIQLLLADQRPFCVCLSSQQHLLKVDATCNCLQAANTGRHTLVLILHAICINSMGA